jgi:hypothetical protein
MGKHTLIRSIPVRPSMSEAVAVKKRRTTHTNTKG